MTKPIFNWNKNQQIPTGQTKTNFKVKIKAKIKAKNKTKSKTKKI
jgi:hypothetical protein